MIANNVRSQVSTSRIAHERCYLVTIVTFRTRSSPDKIAAANTGTRFGIGVFARSRGEFDGHGHAF